jgi:hypothetical protein
MLAKKRGLWNLQEPREGGAVRRAHNSPGVPATET